MTVGDSDTEAGRRQRIALVAHDGRQQDMREWAEFNRDLLAGHQLYATGTTGRMLSEELGLPVTRLHSGPFRGDQQVGGPHRGRRDRRAGVLLGPDGAASP